MADDLQKTTKLPYIRIETGTLGDSPESSVFLDIQYGAQDEVLARIKRGEAGGRSYILMRNDAEFFWERILAILAKPESASGTHPADTYYARVHWQKIDFVNSHENQPEGDFYAESGELPADGIEEFIAMIDYQENEEKIRQILAKDLHQRALEIYRETKSLTDYFYPPD